MLTKIYNVTVKIRCWICGVVLSSCSSQRLLRVANLSCYITIDPSQKKTFSCKIQEAKPQIRVVKSQCGRRKKVKCQRRRYQSVGACRRLLSAKEAGLVDISNSCWCCCMVLTLSCCPSFTRPIDPYSVLNSEHTYSSHSHPQQLPNSCCDHFAY